MTIETLRPLVALSAVGWLAIGLVGRNYSPKRSALALVGVLWSVVGVVTVDIVAARLDWWHYLGDAPQLGETPVDVLLVWAVVWGGMPLVVLDVVRPIAAATVLAILDLLLVPKLNSIVDLGVYWWIGEAALIALVLIPGLFLLMWMQTGTRLWTRTAMIVGLLSAFMMWIVPILAAELTGIPVRPAWSGRAWLLWLQIMSVPATLGVSAVIELAMRGGGTPYPWDPTLWVVSSGPYAYVSNPMQLSMVALLPLLAVALWHWPTLIAGGVATAFAIGVADQHEALQLKQRWGEQWTEYRFSHRSWLPRWQPTFAPETQALLYVDLDCATCTELATFLERRVPASLQIVPATDHPGLPLERITYRNGDTEHNGVRAVAAALEHTNLGWAFVGWFLRLPPVAVLAELISDVTGNGPHKAGTGDCVLPDLPATMINVNER